MEGGRRGRNTPLCVLPVEQVDRLEREIDVMNAELRTPVRRFILAWWHRARRNICNVCRPPPARQSVLLCSFGRPRHD